MKEPGGARPVARISPALSSSCSCKPPAPVSHPPPADYPTPSRSGTPRGRNLPIRVRGFGGEGATVATCGVGGGRSRPATPLLRWKFEDAGLSGKPAARPEPNAATTRRKTRSCELAKTGDVSARKLAAGIWRLQVTEFSVPVRRVSAWPVHGHLRSPYVCKLNSRDLYKDPSDEVRNQDTVRNLTSGLLSKREHSVALANSAMERATKWDPGSSEVSVDVFQSYGHPNLLRDQHVTTSSVVSSLQAELEQARAQICKLECKRQSSKKKLDHFLEKLNEEKASWRRREHEKVRAIVDDMKCELKREKKNRQRMEIMNSKLVSEITEAKLSAKRHLQDYEKERRARQLMEEVCDELAKEIGVDKAETEALKRESFHIREEVEEERKMLQVAEVWREERVQMKLIDAKLTLEEKYCQLNKLQSDLEAFLRERNSSKPSVEDIKEAQLLRDAANRLRSQEIKEFVYQPPPASEDILAVFEELHPGEEANERHIEQCYIYSPLSRSSKIHTVSPEINGFSENTELRYADGTIDRNGDIDDDSGWETESHPEELGSSNSPSEREPSVNGVCESNASVSGSDWEDNADDGKASSEISEVCYATSRQSRKKMSSIPRRRRSSCPCGGENHKIVSVEITNGQLPNGRISNGTPSPDVGLGEEGISPPSAHKCSSPDSIDSLTPRGIKGCIEWPRVRVLQKQSLKAGLHHGA